MKSLKIILLICLCWLISDVAVGSDSLSLLLPSPEDGWKKAGAPEMYDRRNLFDYIDGGAELFLAYDFQKVAVQKFIPTRHDSIEDRAIIVEIWQMKSSADAFGIFSLEQDGETVKIGQSGVYNDGLLRFWKDAFFVKILETVGGAKETIFQLGGKIDLKIQKEGNLPLLMQKVPSDSLVPGSVYFFHKQIILNDLFPFSNLDMLGLGTETDCVLADFRVCEDHLKLLLIQYPDTAKAKNVKDKLKEPFLAKGALASDKLFVSKEKGLMGMDLSQNSLILVFNGRNKQNILWLLSYMKGSVEGKESQFEPKCFRFR